MTSFEFLNLMQGLFHHTYTGIDLNLSSRLVIWNINNSFFIPGDTPVLPQHLHPVQPPPHQPLPQCKLNRQCLPQWQLHPKALDYWDKWQLLLEVLLLDTPWDMLSRECSVVVVSNVICFFDWRSTYYIVSGLGNVGLIGSWLDITSNYVLFVSFTAC